MEYFGGDGAYSKPSHPLTRELSHRESLYDLSFCAVGEGFPLPRGHKVTFT